jgi:hypothetical protein
MFVVTEESYQEVKVATKEICKEIGDLNDNYEYEKELIDLLYIFTGDMKMLHIMTGIKACNSNHPCVWCVVHKNKLYSKYSSFSRKTKFNNEKHGKIRKSLLPKNIPIKNVVMDTLHLFLRIGTKLLDLVIKELGFADREPSSLKPKHKNLNKFQKFVNKICNNSYHMYSDAKTKSFKGRTLRGNELMQVLEKINVPRLLPNYEHCRMLQEIIKDFLIIIKRLRNEDISWKELELCTTSWMEKFTSIFIKKHVTPYMHAFQSHLHIQTRLHGSVNLFNLEGLEKQNAITTKTFFRSTNFKNKPVKQILLRFLRLEKLREILSIVIFFIWLIIC